MLNRTAYAVWSCCSIDPHGPARLERLGLLLTSGKGAENNEASEREHINGHCLI